MVEVLRYMIDRIIFPEVDLNLFSRIWTCHVTYQGVYVGVRFGMKLKLAIRSIKWWHPVLSGCAQIRKLWWENFDQLLLSLKTEEGLCHLSCFCDKLWPDKRRIERKGLPEFMFEKYSRSWWHRHGRKGAKRCLSHIQEAEKVGPETRVG